MSIASTRTRSMQDAVDSRLAIHGGVPVREAPMPARMAVGPEERRMIDEALDHYHEQGLDPGYQGVFEERYCAAFVEMMGGGYADAVATGTASLYVAIAALELPPGSEVIVSPITDPGTISAIILNGLTPVLADSEPDSYNVGPVEIEARISDRTSCILAVHSLGRAAEIDAIAALAEDRGLRLIEDCSQAHGAIYKGRRIGTYGDIAAFSTMYRKASITGASGGVVYSRDEQLYRKALAYADRGKPRWEPGFDDRDPAQFLFPALNLHSDELSCAVGIASVRRLDETRRKRLAFVKELTQCLEAQATCCRPYGYSPDDSPFVYPIFVAPDRLSVSKQEFAGAVRAEGIGLSVHYRYLVADWPWVRPYLTDGFACPNARNVRDRTFNLYLNEQYERREVEDTIAAICKVEHALAGR